MTYATDGVRDLLTVFYVHIFGREPDTDGLHFWWQKIIAGETFAIEALHAFNEHPEAKNPLNVKLDIVTKPDVIVTEPEPTGSAWADDWPDDWPVVDRSKAIGGYAEGMRLESIKNPRYHIILHRYVVPVNEGPVWFFRFPGKPFEEPPPRISPEHLAMRFRHARRP